MSETQDAIPGRVRDAGATQTPSVGLSDTPTFPSPQIRSQRLATVITCSGCDAKWTGQGRMHCAGCHQLFAGLALFDSHRRDVKGVGTCLDLATLPSMRLVDGVWRGPEMTDEQKAKAFG